MRRETLSGSPRTLSTGLVPWIRIIPSDGRDSEAGGLLCSPPTGSQSIRASLIPRTSGDRERSVVVTANNLVDDVHGTSLGLLEDSTHVEADYSLNYDEDPERQENQGYETGPAC